MPALPSLFRRQAVVRPLVATTLLAVVTAVLATGRAQAETAAPGAKRFLMTATATRPDHAAAMLGQRAARACGFATADKGWHPAYRLSDLHCTGVALARHHCQAWVSCEGPGAALAAR